MGTFCPQAHISGGGILSKGHFVRGHYVMDSIALLIAHRHTAAVHYTPHRRDRNLHTIAGDKVDKLFRGLLSVRQYADGWKPA